LLNTRVAVFTMKGLFLQIFENRKKISMD
jgi:hypothetical protein